MAVSNVSSKLVLAFVTLILGAVLIGVIASNSLAVTDKQSVSDESFDYSDAMIAEGQVNETSGENYVTVTYAPTSWKTTDCPLTNVVVTNSSGTVWTDDTDYTLDESTGLVTILNTTATETTLSSDNTTLIDYTYCGDDYMNLSWGRTIINLLAGFFALALLGTSIGLFYSVAKDTNMI